MSHIQMEDRLQTVLDRLQGVQPSGNGYKACCPAHNDRNPSFQVWELPNGDVIFKCHKGCKYRDVLTALELTRADLITLANGKGLKDRNSSRPAYNHMLPRYDKRLLAQKQEPTADWGAESARYREQFTPETMAAHYLAARGISYEVAKQYGVGFCPQNDWCQRNKYGKPMMPWKYGRVTFPHTTPLNQVVNIYGRAIGEATKLSENLKQRFKQAKHLHLSGAKGVFNARALLEDTVFICEGVFDALSLISAGYPNSCAIFGVKGFPHWDWIQAKTLIFCLDNDSAGQQATQELSMQAVLRGKRVFTLDADLYQGKKDLNAVWAKYGAIQLDDLDDSIKQEPIVTLQVPEVALQEVATTVAPVKPTEQRTDKPLGYYAIGSHEREKLEQIKAQIIQAGIVAFDYESNSDPDAQHQDPQDTQVVGVSLSWQIGEAVYLPIDHKGYEHNWKRAWLFDNFLKPILLHPDIMILAHNIKIEQQWSILNGLNLYPKAMQGKAMDTMLMVKALALPENTDKIGKVRMGLKPATKALLADTNGNVHNLLHVDDIKSFKETVGVIEWQVPDPSGALYKSGKRKGTPKMLKKKRTRRFDELPVDPATIAYACSDADWTLGLYEKLKPLCEREGLLNILHEIDVPRMMLLGEYELSGWHIDTKKLQDMRADAETKLPLLEQQLTDELKKLVDQNTDDVIVPAGSYDMGEGITLTIKTDKPFSWGSTQHKQWLFFHVLQLGTKGLKHSDKTGLPSVGAENFDKLVTSYTGESPFMDLLKEKASHDKISSTYVNGMGSHVREDTNKIHTQFGLVDTWRYSSKKPNLQNIPKPDRDPFGIRELFVAPTYDPKADYTHLNDWTKPVSIIQEEKLSGETLWIGADYSQLELRVVAVMAQEQGMIDAFHAGYDMHSATAKKVFNLPCSVEEVSSQYKSYRKKAKAVNFGLVYGISKYGLSGQLKIPVEEADELMQAYFKTYPNIKKFMDGQIGFARNRGYVETLFRHRRPILRPLKGTQIRQSMNTPVQGGGADIITYAMVVFRNIQEDIHELKRRNLLPILERMGLSDIDYIKRLVSSIKAVMQIHDEIIFEVPVEYAADGAKLVKAVMECPLQGFTDVVPLVVDPAVGKTWAHNLDIDWDTNGTPYVVVKKKKHEPADVTIDEIQYALALYEQAGIAVRIQ